MRTHTRFGAGLIVALVALLVLAGCGGDSSDPPATPTPSPAPAAGTLRIVSGSENRTLEDLVLQEAQRLNLDVTIDYRGSVEIMRELQDNGASSAYDVVWPANSMWIALGDTNHVVKQAQSIMRSPIVFALKRSVGQRLGWVSQNGAVWSARDVVVDDILQATDGGQLTFAMTNAAQSNSGASAYISYLYAFAGHPEELTAANLQDPTVRDKITKILGAVDRSAGSSGFLGELFVNDYDSLDAMVNYEAVVIETNQQLVRDGKEPLFVVYPKDGLAIADSPFAYIDKGDPAKEAAFGQLQTFLLSPATQQTLLDRGRRSGPFGLNPDPAAVDPAVFNPEWGIDVARTISTITFPPPAVVQEALTLYQTTFRKPSFTVFCLDFSGSMEGAGERDLTRAMRTLLIQAEAERYLLQTGPNDVTVVIPFDDKLKPGARPADWTVVGNNPAALERLFGQVEAMAAGGGTDIYEPVVEALAVLKQRGYEGYSASIILLTDGKSEGEIGAVTEQQDELAIHDVPIYSITFGDADPTQLERLAELRPLGRVFNGQTDLIAAFREAKGYT